MIVVAGWLRVRPEERDGYVADCRTVVGLARDAEGCLDFAITADTLEADRIVVYERWTDWPQLLAFRGSGPSGDQEAAVLAADVTEYEVVPAAG